MRSFLGDFFDHDRELNHLVSRSLTIDPRALVLLDDTKIQTELTTLKKPNFLDVPTFLNHMTPAGKYINPEPRDRKCLATNLLSVRQIAQVLEAFAAMGVGNANSRVVRTLGGNDESNDDVYTYKLHEGDSIIGETRIYDSDAVNTDQQYSQNVKVQIVQSLDGAYAPSHSTPMLNPPTAHNNIDNPVRVVDV